MSINDTFGINDFSFLQYSLFDFTAYQPVEEDRGHHDIKIIAKITGRAPTAYYLEEEISFQLFITRLCPTMTVASTPLSTDEYSIPFDPLTISMTFTEWTHTPTYCEDSTYYEAYFDSNNTLIPTSDYAIVFDSSSKTFTVQTQNLAHVGTYSITVKGYYDFYDTVYSNTYTITISDPCDNPTISFDGMVYDSGAPYPYTLFTTTPYFSLGGPVSSDKDVRCGDFYFIYDFVTLSPEITYQDDT